MRMCLQDTYREIALVSELKREKDRWTHHDEEPWRMKTDAFLAPAHIAAIVPAFWCSLSFHLSNKACLSFNLIDYIPVRYDTTGVSALSHDEEKLIARTGWVLMFIILQFDVLNFYMLCCWCKKQRFLMCV